MHYIICYDLENDRLRAAVAKTLESQGCRRIQKSVFIAPHLRKRELGRLMQALRRRVATGLSAGSDSILAFPLPPEYTDDLQAIGQNNASAALEDLPLKIIL